MARLPSLFTRSRSLFPFEPWFSGMEDWVSPALRSWTPTISSSDTGSFPVDVQETDKEYVIKADLPGITKDNVTLSLDNSVLTIEVKEAREEERKENSYIMKERFSSFTSRSLNLPFATTEAKVNAALRDGVLTISVPKSMEKQTRKIAIN